MIGPLRPVALAAALLIACAAPASSPQQSSPSNAADAYNQAFAWWDTAVGGDSPALTEHELNLLREPLEGGPTPEIRAALAKIRPYLELVHTGGRTPTCEFAIDRSQGYMLQLPHLQKMRNAAWVLRLDAQVRMHDGDLDRATQSLQTLAGFSEHVRGDTTMVSSLVSVAMLTVQDRTVEELLNTGSLDAAQADVLAKALEPMRGADPFGLVAAVRAEGDAARTTFDDALADGNATARTIADVFSVAGLGNPGIDLEPEELRSQLDRMDALCDSYADAVANPDRQAARNAMSELEARIASGVEGDLAKLLMPAVARAAAATWTMTDNLEARYRMLDDIRTGKVSAAHYANAAIAYMRAAGLVEGMPLDRQREIEVARVAAEVLEPDARAAARQAIDPYRAPLRACFQEAAPRSRCDFSVAYRNGVRKPSLYPAYLLNLRGAVRLMLADALLGTESSPADGSARRRDEPLVSAEEAIAAALRCASHVASDPVIGHTFAAESMLHEIAVALKELRRRRLLDAEAAGRLALIANRLDRAGPMGLKAAVARDRKRLFEYYGFRGTEPTDGHPLEERNASAVAACVFATQLLSERDRTPDGFAEKLDAWESEKRFTAPLLGVGDLLTLDCLRAVRATIEAILERPDPVRRLPRDAIESNRSLLSALLDSLAPQPSFDVAVLAADSSAQIATIDTLLAPESAAATQTPAAPPSK